MEFQIPKYTIGRHIPKNDLAVGMWLIGKNVSSCWKENNKEVPHELLCLANMNHKSLSGHQTTCSCSDLNKLYEVIWDTQKTQSSISSPQFTMAAKVQSFIERKLNADELLIHSYFINGDNLLNEIGVAEVLNFLAFENKEIYAHLVKRAQEFKADEEKR